MTTTRIPVATTLKSDGAVYIYDQIGHYYASRRPHSGKAVSAHITGNNLVIRTDKGKTIVYECRAKSTFYKYTR
jgi:hypothetical protein